MNRARANLTGAVGFLSPPGEARPDPDLGVRQARLLGARFIVLAGTPAFLEASDLTGARQVARDSIWRLFEIQDDAVALDPGTLHPVPPDSLPGAAAEWFASGGRLPLPVAAPPPVAGGSHAVSSLRSPEAAVRMLPGEIRFSGARPGTPLLLRLSYFPAWRLVPPGAGPYPAAPHHLLVVPASEEVRLVWRPGRVETLARLVSLIAAAVLVLALAASLVHAERGFPGRPAHGRGRVAS